MSYEPKTYLSQDRILVTDEFISRNKLKLRSPEEIADKLDAVLKEGNMFEFRHEVLLDYITFERAKEKLKADYVAKVESGEAKWEPVNTIEEAAQDFLDYMNFAWGKAEDERGISASRSIYKLGAWLWIMGREDLEAVLHDKRLYNPYGAPALIAVCEKMEIPVPASLVEFAQNPI